MRYFKPKNGWKQWVPTHIENALYSDWKRCFVWWPQTTEQDEQIWLTFTFRRIVRTPLWFQLIPEFEQYSDIKKGRYEL